MRSLSRIQSKNKHLNSKCFAFFNLKYVLLQFSFKILLHLMLSVLFFCQVPHSYIKYLLTLYEVNISKSRTI